jgi:hypothetical protein
MRYTEMMKSTKESKSITLHCFTPQVALATFIIEIVLAVYAWIRFRTTPAGRRGVVFLLSLSLFQFAEFQLCSGVNQEVWMRTAFLATVFLPAIAIDFVAMATKRPMSVVFGYATATAYALLIIFTPNVFFHASCRTSYTVFDVADTFGLVYSIYYATSILYGVFALIAARRERAGNQKLTLWLLIGYASILLPTIFVFSFFVITLNAFPSIFCGFAVLIALIMALKVLPLQAGARKQ